jgi:small subunit ribosomal protein S16
LKGVVLAVHLRLRRTGKKKQPFYRIVAIDSRVARDGKYLDNLGTYNPRTEPAAVAINSDRAFYWLLQGAKPSDTVHNLLRQQGVMMRWHLQKRGLDEAKIGEEMQKWQALQAEKQKRQEARREQKKQQRQAKKAASAAKPEGEAASAAAPAD